MMFISGILFGLQSLMTGTIINVWTSHIVVTPQREPQLKQFIPNQDDVRARIETIPGILATSRRYSLAGSIVYDKEKTGQFTTVSGVISGIDPQEESRVLQLANKLVAGEFLVETDRDQILLSSALAGGYNVPAPADLGGVRIGDKVQVTFSNGVIRTYTIKGIYDDSIGIFETFITAKEAESVANIYNSASRILVKTDLERTPIENYLARIKALVPNLWVQDYNAIIGAFSSFLGALNLISFIVSAISVLVATITIFVMVYVNAVSKRRQIGILKAIGIKERIIVLSYVFQSIFYASCGIVVGSFLVFAVLTPLLAAYPIDVIFGGLSLVHKTATVVVGIISLFIAGLLAGYVPARIVARQDILKAIWG
jgi:putative ABC transport system permease protein